MGYQKVAKVIITASNFIKCQALWISFLITTVLHLPLSVFPMGRDQGVWATAGMAINQGAVFFKDFAHFNLPGLGFSYALALKFVDDPRVATMLLNLTGSLLIIVGMFFLLRLTLGETTASFSILLYSLIWPTYQDFWGISQKDYMAMYGVFLSTWLFARANNEPDLRRLSIYSAGIFVALSSMYKPLFVVAGIVLALFHTVVNTLPQMQSRICNRQEFKRILGDLSIFLGGQLSVAAIFLMYLIFNDAFESFYNGIFVIAPAYSTISRLPSSDLLSNLFVKMAVLARPIDWGAKILFLLWMPVALISFIFTIRLALTRKTIWILNPYMVALATFWAQGKAFEYHIAPWQICIIMSVGILFSELYQKNSASKHLAVSFCIIMVCIICGRALFSSQFADTMATWLKMKTRAEYLQTSFKSINPSIGVPTPLASELISEWVSQNSEASDKILVWGLECQIYALSRRMYATNSPFDFILTGNFSQNVRASIWQACLKKQFIQKLYLEKPKHIIITSKDENPIEHLPSNESAKLIPEFMLLIEKEYRMVLEIFPFEIYQRKS